MTYLLDTDVCVNILRGRDEALRERLAEIPAGEVALCSMVLAELLVGAVKSARREANVAAIEVFAGEFVCLPFDATAARVYAGERARLESIGQTIGPNDMVIASISMVNDLILVTHNVSEFSRVEGLKVEDWELSG